MVGNRSRPDATRGYLVVELPERAGQVELVTGCCGDAGNRALPVPEGWLSFQADAAEADIPDEDVSYPACKDDRVEGGSVVMSWLILVISGLLESVWAVALSRSAGFTRPIPSVLFGVALVLSMSGLGYALRTIPVGTGYAVWVGTGAAGTALAGMFFLGESASVMRVLSLLLVLAGVVGLKLFA